MASAGSFGHLVVVEILHQHRTEGTTTNAMNWAAATALLEVVHWLPADRSEGCSALAFYYAARNDKMEMLRFLVTLQGTEALQHAFAAAKLRSPWRTSKPPAVRAPM
ncbi:hypothetical protein SDRG_16340, partial [Saprolegnia diclina VS20]